MSTTFVPDGDLTAAAQAANAMLATPLPGHWGTITPRANQRAYNLLQRILLQRGYTPQQFQLWGGTQGNNATLDGYDWNLRLGVLFSFIEASRGDTDRGNAYREELKQMAEEIKDRKLTPVVYPDPVTGLMQAQYPQGTFGRVGIGSVDTSEDRFLLDDVAGDLDERPGSFPVPGDGTRL